MKITFLPYILVLSTIVCGNSINVFANGTPPKVPVDSLETLDFPEEFPEDFDFQSEFFAYVSSGWFPTPFPRQAILIGIQSIAKVDEARNIRSSGFVPTTNPLQGNVLFRDRHRSFPDEYFITVDPFSEETAIDDIAPIPYCNEYSIDYILQGYVPIFLQFRAGYREARTILTSVDTSRSYLSLAGNKKNFTEITSIDIFERRLFFTPKVVIPIYGLYSITEDQSLSSVYYLFGSYDMEHVFSIDIHQYAQLADVKQELRYENGTDVQTIERKNRLSTLNNFRATVHSGMGIDFSADFFRFQLEAFAGFPTRSILNDDSWRQFPWGFRFNLGFEY
jgi:hypothetical protein